MSTAPVLSTERLVLRRLVLEDAPFIIQLLNEPGWLRFIGDKGVRSVQDAHRYLLGGPLASYEQFGFGLYCVSRQDDGAAIGMCGLIKRETLDDVDIGFAFLAAASGNGFAHEAAAAVVEEARSKGLRRLVAITTPDNHRSQSLLRKVGMNFEREIILPGATETLHLFAIDWT